MPNVWSCFNTFSFTSSSSKLAGNSESHVKHFTTSPHVDLLVNIFSVLTFLNLIHRRMWQQKQVFLLTLSMLITGSFSLSVTVSSTISVSRGQDAILGCYFSHSRQQTYSGLITVSWLARDSNTQPLLICEVRNDSREGLSDCSASRLKHSLSGDPRRADVSLRIRNVALTDNGTYFCKVKLDGSKTSQKATHLYVNAGPEILSLSVLETTSDSAPSRLQCKVEGNPLPKVVWLSASRRKVEDQVETFPSGLYQVTSSVPYLKEEVLTCRAESRLGEAEMTYPPSLNETLIISLTVSGLILLLLAGLTVCCLNNRAPAEASPVDGNTEVDENDTEVQLVYTTVNVTPTCES
uniref:Sialic acid-binding Ig-like lectin 15 n=1 Tax=Mastacembelus armatus TaxID=205130 RepID=A0A7N8Y403_9TELE